MRDVLLVLIDGPALGVSVWARIAPAVVRWSEFVREGGATLCWQGVYRLSSYDLEGDLPVALYRYDERQEAEVEIAARGPPVGV